MAENKTLKLSLLDEYDRPTCANVGIFRNDERIWRSYVGEETQMTLEEGEYELVIRRGKLYEPIRKKLSLFEDVHLTFRLTRLTDPKKLGFYAFDAHSHISRMQLGENGVMDIEKMSVRARGEDWNVYFAGTPYDGENHLHIYQNFRLDTPSYRVYYRELLSRVSRPDYLADPGNEFIKYRYGHIVLANYEEKPSVDEFRDPLYHAFERDIHVPCVEPPPFLNLPPSRAIKRYRDENSFAFFAHPTSWWRLDRNNAFVTNIASTAAYDALTGMVDGIVVQGYGADKPWYRAIWYTLLNHGYRLTGVAETDTCGDDPDHLSGKRMVEPYRTYARCGKLDLNALSAAVRRGDCFATSGPLLDYTVDGERPGGMLAWDPKKEYVLDAQGWRCCDGALSEVEIVRNGETAARLQPDASGHVRFALSLPAEGYLLCILRDDAGNVAVGNPVYIRNTPFINDGYRARVRLDVLKNGQGANGFYTTDECADPVVFDGRIDCRINPMSRIFVTVDGEEKVYDPFEDETLQACFRHTYAGEFLRDNPSLVDGEVPPEAFCVPEILDRLQNLTGKIDFGFSPDAVRLLRKNSKIEPCVPSPLLKPFPSSSFPKDDFPLPDPKVFEQDVPRLRWVGHEDVCGAMEKAFALVGRKITRPPEESGLPRRLVYTEFADSIFLWGISFITQFGLYASHLFPFEEMLDNFYAKQHADGFICRQINLFSGEDMFEKNDLSSTGPNILAWTEWRVFEHTGNLSRLKKIYPSLLAYHRWLRKNRTWQNGAYFSSGWGSGMDNIPRLDEAKYNPAWDHGHLCWIDTTAQQALSAKSLLRIAGVLGLSDACTRELEQEYAQLKAFVNTQMWNEADGFYEDTDAQGRPTGVMHIGAYWTLLAGLAPEERLDRFLEPLKLESMFAAPMGTRSLSAAQPEFCPQGGDYWRGGVWCITEYMLMKGLEESGREELAFRLARKHVEAVAAVCRDTGTIWESYDPCRIAPGRLQGQLVRRDFVGFSGVTPIAMALEDVLGLKIRGDEVIWNIRLQEAHGVENLKVCGKRVDLNYEDGRVRIFCEGAFTLRLQNRSYPLSPGEHTLCPCIC